MEIGPLDREAYADREFTAPYKTGGYYDICVCESGFSIIGIDLYSYANNDPKRHEVRRGMGKKLRLRSAAVQRRRKNP